MISLVGLDKAEVLAALFNASRQQGMCFLNARGAAGMDVSEARSLLAKQTYFDYLHGRVMKIDLSDDEMREALYDRDNGQGAAEAAISPLRRSARQEATTRRSDDDTFISTMSPSIPSMVSDDTPTFSGSGGSSGGAGASASWDSGSNSSDSSSSYSSSDSGSSSSDSGSSGGSSD